METDQMDLSTQSTYTLNMLQGHTLSHHHRLSPPAPRTVQFTPHLKLGSRPDLPQLWPPLTADLQQGANETCPLSGEQNKLPHLTPAGSSTL